MPARRDENVHWLNIHVQDAEYTPRDASNVHKYTIHTMQVAQLHCFTFGGPPRAVCHEKLILRGGCLCIFSIKMAVICLLAITSQDQLAFLILVTTGNASVQLLRICSQFTVLYTLVALVACTVYSPLHIHLYDTCENACTRTFHERSWMRHRIVVVIKLVV